MRHFWASFLITGLILMGLNAYERRQARGGLATGAVAAASEDGTPIPQPDPTPVPKR
jgi:hypothetical protein